MLKIYRLLRTSSTIQRLLTQRRLEIFIAGMAFWFGVWLLLPMTSMRTAGYAALLRMMSEDQWGMIYLLNGLNHGLALAINGSRWWSPLIRWIASFSSMSLGIVWGSGFYAVDPASTAVFMYFFVAAVGGGWCAAAAWRDSIRASRMEAVHAACDNR